MRMLKVMCSVDQQFGHLFEGNEKTQGASAKIFIKLVFLFK